VAQSGIPLGGKRLIEYGLKARTEMRRVPDGGLERDARDPATTRRVTKRYAE
jgi:hypothetical protein